MSERDTLTILSEEMGKALLPLAHSIESPMRFASFMRDLGWEVLQVPQPIADLSTQFTALTNALQALQGDTPSLQQFEKLRAAISGVFVTIDVIRSAPDSAIPATLLADDFLTEFPEQVVQHLLVDYLIEYHPRIAYALRLLGLIRIDFVSAAGNRPTYMARRIAWKEFAKIFNDPVLVFERAYEWRTSKFRYQELFETVQELIHSVGFDLYLEELDPRLVRALEGSTAVQSRRVRWSLKAPLFEGEVGGALLEAGLALFALPEQGTHLPGLSLLPYASGEFRERFQITEHLWLQFQSAFDLAAGVGILVRPNEPVELLTDIIPSVEADIAPPSAGFLRIRLEYTNTDGMPIVLLGSASGSRLEVQGVSATGSVAIDSTNSRELSLEIALVGARLVIRVGEGDSFLQRVLPGAGLETGFDATVGWSSKRGLYFAGSGNFEITRPVHKSFGPITLDAVHVSLIPNAQTGIHLRLSATAKVAIGPIIASIESVGLDVVFGFMGDTSGNLGPLDVRLAFKPPDGAGMVIDSPAIVGGGYLLFDPKNEQYAGILQLEIKGGISLKAIGLLTTRLPDGSKGFSLLVIITAEFPPIVLGFGFTLNGVGGLLGVNRTMVLEVLRAGVKNRTLDSIMFPHDPVKNAQKIISDLQSGFPPVSGQFVIGPMAKLAWGKPATILTIDLGILLEFPVSLRAVIMGRLLMVLPSKEVPVEAQVAVLRMDVLGTIDFNKGDAAIDATIYDSRIAAFTITGEMAMRLNWGASPAFALSAGGFNPRFQPQPSFPSLGRMAIALATGDNPRLRLEAYLALTTNTLQFGARLDLYAEINIKVLGKFSAAANLSFDALVNFQPFSFLVDIDGQAAFKHNGKLLLPVSLHLTLSGPQPWLAVGEVTFDFVGKHQILINLRIGEEPVQVLPPPGDPLGELKQALQDPRNWSAQLPSDGHTLVTLRKIEVTKELLVHPFGELTVRQKVVPLEVAISKFGSTTPADKGPFTISSIRFGTQPTAQAREEARDHFAPGQFFDLSDDEKLSLPAFQPLPSGCTRIGTKEISFSSVQIGASFQYDTVVIDKKEELKSRKGKGFEYAMAKEVLVAVAALGAAGQSAMRSTGSAKFAGSGEQRITFKDPAYAVASKDGLVGEVKSLGGETKTFESYVEAEAARRQKDAAGANYQTVGRHEVV